MFLLLIMNYSLLKSVKVIYQKKYKEHGIQWTNFYSFSLRL